MSNKVGHRYHKICREVIYDVDQRQHRNTILNIIKNKSSIIYVDFMAISSKIVKRFFELHPYPNNAIPYVKEELNSFITFYQSCILQELRKMCSPEREHAEIRIFLSQRHYKPICFGPNQHFKDIELNDEDVNDFIQLMGKDRSKGIDKYGWELYGPSDLNTTDVYTIREQCIKRKFIHTSDGVLLDNYKNYVPLTSLGIPEDIIKQVEREQREQYIYMHCIKQLEHIDRTARSCEGGKIINYTRVGYVNFITRANINDITPSILYDMFCNPETGVDFYFNRVKIYYSRLEDDTMMAKHIIKDQAEHPNNSYIIYSCDCDVLANLSHIKHCVWVDTSRCPEFNPLAKPNERYRILINEFWYKLLGTNAISHNGILLLWSLCGNDYTSNLMEVFGERKLYLKKSDEYSYPGQVRYYFKLSKGMQFNDDVIMQRVMSIINKNKNNILGKMYAYSIKYLIDDIMPLFIEVDPSLYPVYRSFETVHKDIVARQTWKGDYTGGSNYYAEPDTPDEFTKDTFKLADGSTINLRDRLTQIYNNTTISSLKAYIDNATKNATIKTVETKTDEVKTVETVDKP